MSYADCVATLKGKLETVDPAKLKGVNAIYQFDLTGDDGGVFYIKIDDGKTELIEAAHDAPSITVSLTAGDFAAMMDGKLNATSAFMAGKLKIKGDMSLAMKLQGLI